MTWLLNLQETIQFLQHTDRMLGLGGWVGWEEGDNSVVEIRTTCDDEIFLIRYEVMCIFAWYFMDWHYSRTYMLYFENDFSISSFLLYFYNLKCQTISNYTMFSSGMSIITPWPNHDQTGLRHFHENLKEACWILQWFYANQPMIVKQSFQVIHYTFYTCHSTQLGIHSLWM